MPKKNTERQRYGNGTLNAAPNGRGWDAFILVDGIRHRKRLPTVEAAKGWITMVEGSTAANRPPLTALQMDDAQKALAVIPAGFTLLDGARALAEKAKGSGGAGIPLSLAVRQYLGARKGKIRDRTLADYEAVLTRLEDQIGGLLREVTRERVDAFLDAWSGETRNRHLRDLNAFFTWCLERELLPASPTARIAFDAREDTEIHVLTVEQAQRLAETVATVAPVMIPYVAMALFAGVRPDELKRLPVRKIGREYILIDGAVSKKRRRRTIPISPALRAWLDCYPPAGPLVFYSRYYLRMAARMAEITWHEDILRHTYCSMEWDRVRDAALVSSWAGNSPDVLLNRYRAQVHPGDGAKFAAIWPAAVTMASIEARRKRFAKRDSFAYYPALVKAGKAGRKAPKIPTGFQRHSKSPAK